MWVPDLCPDASAYTGAAISPASLALAERSRNSGLASRVDMCRNVFNTHFVIPSVPSCVDFLAYKAQAFALIDVQARSYSSKPCELICQSKSILGFKRFHYEDQQGLVRLEMAK